MSGRDLVKTGITGLDDILSEGIPRGNVILLEGSIGTRKTTFGVEFVAARSARLHKDSEKLDAIFEDWKNSGIPPKHA